ncbi:MAG: class I SAM-dependent methyltransferase [Hyphomonadaceae bacterium]|nr:class I SAM-dependent methyltransferase [Hyphomonadaceae bacterium]
MQHDIVVSEEEVERELARLDPATPWSHHYKFGSHETISAARDEKFYKKSIGLERLGELAIDIAKYHTRAGGIAGQRVIDIASAEGGHSLLFARGGAKEVLGVEGRSLYMERAKFAARAYGLSNVTFTQGDVRKIDAAKAGRFDIVFCSGILHHLGKDDFLPMLKLLYELTGDMMFLYTHVSHPEKIEPYRLKPTEPINGRYAGYLFQEHSEAATASEREAQVRASLDNTYSFWATPGSLVDALKDVGYSIVSNVVHPHIFGRHEDRAFRPIIVARR